jgi:hypothetical protein
MGSFAARISGAQWSRVADGNFRALIIDPVDPSIVYAGTERGGVLRSTDGGSTFFSKNNGLGA